MTFSLIHNVSAFIKAVRASDNVAATAAGAGDNTAVTGQIIDRHAFGNPLSLALVILFKAVLAAAETLKLKSVLVEHGDQSNLSDAATFKTLEDSTGSTVATGAGTIRDQKQYAVDLVGAKRYIRIKFTPDLSASATDTAELSALVVAGGQESLS